jgi:hypothetical protein
MPCLVLTLLVGLMAAQASAGLIATNEEITTSYLNAGGVEGNPADYVYNSGYAKAWGTAIFVGAPAPFQGKSSTSWNRINIRDGATISTTVDNSYIGNVDGSGTSDHNQVVVTGSGSSLTLKAFRISNSGSYNNLTVENGASFVGGACLMTRNSGAWSSNSIVVDNGYAAFSGAITIGYETNHVGNSVTVMNGGTLTNGYTSGAGLVIGRYGSYGDVRVSGSGSRLVLAGTVDITQNGNIGYGHHNTLTLWDQSLTILQKDASGSIKFYGGAATPTGLMESYIRFAAGYLAYRGERTNELVNSRVQAWNGTSWEAGNKGVNWKATYCQSDEAAAVATDGFYPAPNGLAGYTIYTGGVGTPLPPKATLIMFH